MRSLAFLVLAAALLAGLFVWFESSPVASTPSVTPELRQFELRIAEGRLVSGPELIQVKQGEDVRLRFHSDRQDELHLHGYDLELALPADETVELRFKAERSGRFEYELHQAQLELGVLEVQPQ